MQDQPDDIDETELRRALSAWGIDATSLTYAPVGFGDHHWNAADDDGRRWFVTVADLAVKPYCGIGPEAAAHGLLRAMDTAAALAERRRLDFVVAPLRTVHGETLRRFHGRYGISVFPHVDGVPGRFSQRLDPPERGTLLDLLAELHRTAPPTSAPAAPPDLSARAALDATLAALASPWHGGPYSEPARDLLADHADGLRGRLREFDRRIAELHGAQRAPVVTHGEPHPGNVLRQDGRLLLVDWDTVGLAVPERDLWLVAEGPDDLARYEEAAGRAPDPSALALYRLRWDLDDVSAYLGRFRAPHTRSADSEKSWTGLARTLERLTGAASRSPQGHPAG